MARTDYRYHASAVYDDMLDICMRCGRIGRSSTQFLPEIYRGEELLVSGELVYVNADPATKKPAPVGNFARADTAIRSGAACKLNLLPITEETWPNTNFIVLPNRATLTSPR